MLRADGYRIVERNLHVGGGELDIVALRHGALRVVEVKARAVGDDTALEALGHHKQRTLRRATESYLLGDVPPYSEVAFLVAVVTMDPTGWTVELIDDAFDG